MTVYRALIILYFTRLIRPPAAGICKIVIVGRKDRRDICIAPFARSIVIVRPNPVIVRAIWLVRELHMVFGTAMIHHILDGITETRIARLLQRIATPQGCRRGHMTR